MIVQDNVLSVNQNSAIHSNLRKNNFCATQELNKDTICFKSKSLTNAGSKNILKKLLAVLGIGTVANTATRINQPDLSYRDYVNVHKFSFPEGSTINLPNGETMDLTEYANTHSFECWSRNNKPKINDFILINPNANEKELKKFIPDIRRSLFGGYFEIPSKNHSFCSTRINLEKANVLIKEGKQVHLYETSKIQDYIPVDAVSNGESGKLKFDKIPYNKKIICYDRAPQKRFIIPAGSQIKIDDNIINVEQNSIAKDSINIDLDSDIPTFIYWNKPTNSQESETMFKTIKNMVDKKELYVKSLLGFKFECLREDGKIKSYRIGDTKFKVINSWIKSTDGSEWKEDTEATPLELDKLYIAHLLHPKCRGTIILSRKDGSITYW